MKIPTIQGIIKRRILLNYRIDPDVVASLIPSPFRPQLHAGFAAAGICLIRLEEIRPRWAPRILGISSENSAHRFAVKWEFDGETQTGVYIPKRHTNSKLNSLAGGRLFPGIHEYASFEVKDTKEGISLSVQENRDVPLVQVSARETDHLPTDSIFTLDESSHFFESGSLGYSPVSNSSDKLDGLRLATESWKVSPLEVTTIASSFFDDRTLFPNDSIQFDHALLMRDIPHCWICENSIT